jgi:TPR repeat protein
MKKIITAVLIGTSLSVTPLMAQEQDIENIPKEIKLHNAAYKSDANAKKELSKTSDTIDEDIEPNEKNAKTQITDTARLHTKSLESAKSADAGALSDLEKKHIDDQNKIEKLTKEAELGNTNAMIELGHIYLQRERENGSKADVKKAFYYFSNAAKRGASRSYANTAFLYRFGLGTKKNYNKAIDLYIKSLDETGDIFDCCVSHYVELQSDLKENKNFVNALNKKLKKHLKKKSNSLMNEKNIADSLFNWNGIVIDWNLANEQSIKWYEKALLKNEDPETQYRLALNYQHSGKSPNNSKALELYKKSAEQGYVWAQSVLGNKYFYRANAYFGFSQQDYKEAFEWHLKAAQQGAAGSQRRIALMYKEGLGVEKDITKAEEWEKSIVETFSMYDGGLEEIYNMYLKRL